MSWLTRFFNQYIIDIDTHVPSPRALTLSPQNSSPSPDPRLLSFSPHHQNSATTCLSQEENISWKNIDTLFLYPCADINHSSVLSAYYKQLWLTNKRARYQSHLLYLSSHPPPPTHANKCTPPFCAINFTGVAIGTRGCDLIQIWSQIRYL